MNDVFNIQYNILTTTIIEITYAANGAIFIAKAREMQYPAPPVANQNCDGPCF